MPLIVSEAAALAVSASSRPLGTSSRPTTTAAATAGTDRPGASRRRAASSTTMAAPMARQVPSRPSGVSAYRVHCDRASQVPVARTRAAPARASPGRLGGPWCSRCSARRLTSAA